MDYLEKSVVTTCFALEFFVRLIPVLIFFAFIALGAILLCCGSLWAIYEFYVWLGGY